MPRVALLLVCLLGLARPALAQQVTGVEPRITSSSLSATDPGTCTTSSAGCVVIIPGGYSAFSIQVSGTWVGTIQFESCTANCLTPASWAPLPASAPGTSSTVTSTTANGLWVSVNPTTYIRARMSAFTSGTANVTLYATLGFGTPTAALGTTTVPLNNVLSATGTNTDNHTNFANVWNWALTADNTTGLQFGESFHSLLGNANAGTQSIMRFTNLGASTAWPFAIDCLSAVTGCGFLWDVTGNSTPPGVGVLPTQPAQWDHRAASSNAVIASWREMNNGDRTQNSGGAGLYIYLAGAVDGIGTTADCAGCEIGLPASQRGRALSFWTNNNYTNPNLVLNVDGSATFQAGAAQNLNGFPYLFPAVAPTANQVLAYSSGTAPYALIWKTVAASTGSSLQYGDGSGGFLGATIGTGLTFSGGTLTATGACSSGCGGADFAAAGTPQCVQSGSGGQTYRDTTNGVLWIHLPNATSTCGWYVFQMQGAGRAWQINQFDYLYNYAATGATSWLLSGTGAGINSNGSAANTNQIDAHGVWLRLTDTTVANNMGQWAGFGLDYTNDFDIVWKMRTDQNAVTNIRYTFYICTGDPSGDNLGGTKGFGFRFSTNASDPGWVGVNGDGTTQHVTGSLGSVTANTIYILRLRRVGSTLFFSVNDGTETSVTANIPSGTPASEMSMYFSVLTGSSGARTFDLQSFGGHLGSTVIGGSL